MPDSNTGFVFGATGSKYITLARRAARTLRGILPNAQIDLFADRDVQDPIFSQVHRLKTVWHRPKMEALRDSRFQRTIYLDCDVMTLADPSDVFDVLSRFDIVGAHENFRNGRVALAGGTGPPNAFPAINSGVLGVTKSDRTQAFLAEWERIMHAEKRALDQPVLRALLYASDLRSHILPFEYNLMHQPFLTVMGPRMTAPRFLHLTHLHHGTANIGTPDTPFDLDELVAPNIANQIRKLLATDRTIGGTDDIASTWDISKKQARKLERLPIPLPWYRRWPRRYLAPLFGNPPQ